MLSTLKMTELQYGFQTVVAAAEMTDRSMSAFGRMKSE